MNEEGKTTEQMRKETIRLYSSLLDTAFKGVKDKISLKEMMLENFTAHIDLLIEKASKDSGIREIKLIFKDRNNT
jgi:hypothetical protein